MDGGDGCYFGSEHYFMHAQPTTVGMHYDVVGGELSTQFVRHFCGNNKQILSPARLRILPATIMTNCALHSAIMGRPMINMVNNPGQLNIEQRLGGNTDPGGASWPTSDQLLPPHKIPLFMVTSVVSSALFVPDYR